MITKALVSDNIYKLLYKTLKIPNLMSIEVTAPKKYKATVIFLHGIGVSKRMWRQVEHDFKQDCQIIKVDLLGFGDSTAKEWLNYSLEDQANSLFLTLFRNNKLITLKPIIIVGHSLGSLVAVEFATRYGIFVKDLVLVSPPIYLSRSNLKERILKKSYKTVLSSRQLLAIFLKIGRTFFGFTTTNSKRSSQAFARSMHRAIIKQNVFTKLAKTKIDTHIIYGIFDPLIVADNLKPLPLINPKISIESAIATHDVRRVLSRKIVNHLDLLLKKRRKK